MQTQFCSKVKTAIFTNEETGKDLVISLGDVIELPNEDEPGTITATVTYMFTHSGDVVINCSEGDDVDPAEIISVNGKKL